MAWVTPKTWVSGSALTAAELNEQIRDNMAHLKALAIIEAAYEEGSWTPAFVVTGSGTPTTTTATGRYQRTGNQVTASCTVTGNVGSSASGFVNISGLPFAAATSLSSWAAHVGYTAGWGSLTGWTLAGLVQSGASVITLVALKDAGAALVGYSALPSTPDCSIIVTATYQV